MCKSGRVSLKVIFLLILFFCGAGYAEQLISQQSYKTFYRLAGSPVMKMSKESAWKSTVPQIKHIKIRSSMDGSYQSALFYNSGSDKKKPLLLALHSWSADYQHHYSIPFGIWASINDWVLIHPDYRGAFTNKNATASELALQDILDALNYALNHAKIDSNRIYITGFSGGAMVTLIMVGKYPQLWAGAAAWVPVYDLAKWYQELRKSRYNYAVHIRNSCGGPPLDGSDSFLECQKRSVSSYLKKAYGKKVPVYIATGINDKFVMPSHSIMAFNDLAEKEDRITLYDMEYIDKYRKIPGNLETTCQDSFFSDVGLPLLFERKSNTVILKIFEGKHDIIFNAGLHWLSRQRK
jgi:dipeptidyl aminopeptidase/acylaminoacyl peptidase